MEQGIWNRGRSLRVSIFVGFVAAIFVFFGVTSAQNQRGYSFLPSSPIESAYADDDDDEDEDEDDDDDDEDDDEDEKRSEKPTTETRLVTRYEVRTISRAVTVLPQEYRQDTDGDGLVDGVDPNPTVDQREYFTDTDGDAVPNAFDRHPNEDDFAYYEGEEDADGNGIIDSYERLARN